jgi:DNA-binding beta-propeller fold protein YncE
VKTRPVRNWAAYAKGGDVYAANAYNPRVQYFTATGSYLGTSGSNGSGNGQFNPPCGVCLNAAGSRVYVADTYNHRIQYFKWKNTSLGRVKALFK